MHRALFGLGGLLVLGIHLFAVPQHAAGQRSGDDFDPAGSWTWNWFRAQPGVDTSMVDWLERTLERDEAVALFERVTRLSRPDAAQLLGSRFYLDPSFFFARSNRPLLDSTASALSRRPPGGPAGVVYVAYHVERLHRETVRWLGGGTGFTPGPLEIEPTEASDRLVVSLDFGPARALLDVVSGKGDADDPELLDEPAFGALFSHRSQSFYAFAIGREALVENLEAAASDRAIDALYRYAFPRGLMHFADVRNRLASYEALVDTLSGRSHEIEAYLSGRLGAYVPDALRVERTVHFLFADGADGWAADGIAAIDLEYFRDDYDRLLRLLAHETYHAVQAEAAPPASTRRLSDVDAAFLNTLNTLLGEGTATYVARPREVSDTEYAELVYAGTVLLTRIHEALYGRSTPDVDLARELRAEGVRRSGPLYWLGAEMARRIEAAGGRRAVTQTLLGDGLDYAVTYLTLAGASDQPLIGPPVAETIDSLHTARR